MGNRFGWHSGKAHTKSLRVNGHKVLESIWIPANQMSLQTSGTAAAAGQQDDVPVNEHTHDNDDEATFSVLIPSTLSNSGKMNVYVYWLSANTSGSKDVDWDIDYRVTAEDADVGAGSVSNVTIQDTDSTTANDLNISGAIEIPATDLTAGSVFHGLFYNDNGEGNIASDCKVVGLKIVFDDSF